MDVNSLHDIKEIRMKDRFLLNPEVDEVTGTLPVTRWRMEKRGEFPKRRQISPNRIAYLESEIIEWMESRPVSEIAPVKQGGS